MDFNSLTKIILTPLTKELALPLSQLIQQALKEFQDERERTTGTTSGGHLGVGSERGRAAEFTITKAIKDLAERGLVRILRVNGGESIISITANGAKMLEMAKQDSSENRMLRFGSRTRWTV